VSKLALVEKWLSSKDIQFPINLDLTGTAMSTGRYLYALKFVKYGLVLDIGCGLGAGSQSISKSKNVKMIIGVDRSKEALKFAKASYRSYNLDFVCADALNLPFVEHAFDTVIGFEIIEHVDNYRLFLNECTRLMKENNLLLLSTPNKLVTSKYWKTPLNPAHVKEFTPNELYKILATDFVVCDIKGQLVKNDNEIMADYFFALAGRLMSSIRLDSAKKIFRKRKFKFNNSAENPTQKFLVDNFSLKVSNMIFVCRNRESNV
jgi:ubiquinone/menaquinone biosynthesis C-methylase UbiE